MRTAAAPFRGFALALMLTCVAPAAYAQPSAALVDSLSRQHRRNDWLVIATDSAWLDANVREIGPAGLEGIRLRHFNRRIEHLPWSSIRRIDRRTSRYGQGLVAGLLLGAGGGVLLAQQVDVDHQASWGFWVGLVGLWLGGRIGALWVSDQPLYRYSVPQVAATDSAASIPEVPQVPVADSWAIWLSPQVGAYWSDRNVRPVGSDRIDGSGGEISLVPPRFPIGARVSFETATSRGRQSGVIAPVFGPTPVEVTTSNRIDWLMAGPLWDPRPHRGGPYLFAMAGLVHVSPRGQAQWGTGPVGAPLTYDMPGLPRSSVGIATSVGGGVRAAFGRPKKLAIVAEVDWRHGTAVDYIGSPGSEGSPDPRFSARHGQLEMFAIRFGIAASWDRRYATRAPQ